MKQNFFKKQVCAVFAAILFGLMLPHAGLAEDAGVSTELTPFKQADLQDQSICKYTYGSQWKGHSGLPPLFGNVKGIYVFSSSNFYAPGLRDISFFQPKNLAILSACTIAKDTGSHIPVYVPDGSNRQYSSRSFVRWPAAQQDGNLIVAVTADFQPKHLYHNVSPGHLIIINVDYYRQDVHDIISSMDNAHCSRSFIYTKDHDKLDMLLTDTLHMCLDEPYYETGQ